MENGGVSPVSQTEAGDKEKVDVINEEKSLLEAELAQVEEDIQTLRETLAVKIRRSNELKKRLGYTTLSTIQHDLVEGLHKLEDTEAYIKTSEFLGKAKDKTVLAAQEAKEKVESTFSAIKQVVTCASVFRADF
ncbi:unnamed protein product [Echinostoma caproni]|uniref:Tumor protein D52 n=1 Tax=Echinostoma caproni TaxID=27848 RepID=A0A183AUY7_9TREM|nr:unnamed protein product [Echinostoma caproni]